MIRFIGGPAHGVNLSFLRAPIILRVVQNGGGEWDALNDLGDTPKPDEKIVVYIRAAGVGTAFVDGTDKQGRRRGWQTSITQYRYLDDQPGDAHTRDGAAWESWAADNSERLIELHREFEAVRQ